MTEVSSPLTMVLGLVSMAADEPVDPGLPLPLPLLLSVVGLIGALLTALIAAISKRWRTPADDRADRQLNIEADERLLERFQSMLKERDTWIEELRAELKEVRAEGKEVREIAESAVTENRMLIDWIYAAVRIVRDLQGIHLLPPPPKGVTIADHPSNKQEAQT